MGGVTMAKYVMALDAGTTSNRCILFNETGEICSMAQKEFRQFFPNPGWVEHDANEIWSTQLGVAVEAMNMINAKLRRPDLIGIMQRLQILRRSESRISVRLRSSGIKKQENLYITQSYGSVAGHLRSQMH